MIMVEGNRAKRTVKDSVFTNLFGDSKYLLQFYQAIHPEDKDVKEDDLQTVTLENILTDGIYNDLGFIKDDKIMILAEAQSTWTSNIIIRALEYLVNSYRRYFLENDMDLYKSKKVRLPKPELYVIYTGNRKNRPEKITLTNEFFHGEETAIEVTVKMIYDGKKGDIINQYVAFTRILNAQIKLHGGTKTAILETIRICKSKDVLKEYLEGKESEVIDIMMQLYDQEEIMRVYLRSERKDAAIQATVEMCQEFGLSFADTVDKVAKKFSMSHERAEEEIREYWQD